MEDIWLIIAVFAILGIATIAMASPLVTGVGTAGVVTQKNADQNVQKVETKISATTHETNTFNNMANPREDKNTAKTVAEKQIKKSANSTEKVEKTAKNAMGGMAKNTNPREHEQKGPTHVKYKPSKYIAMAIPLTHHGKEAAKEINGEGALRCKNGVCTIIADKNTGTKQIEHILEKIIGNRPNVMRVRAKIIRKGDYAVAKAVVVEKNSTEVSYATADQGIFAVTVEIPKTEVNSAKLIEGNVIFLQTDPVLRIYLRSENNQIAVARFTIKKAVDLNTKDSIEFASCSIGVKNVNVDSGAGKLTFQISDGNQLVYIPSVKIVAPGTIILPQYDSQTKTYSAKIKDVSDAKIEAYVDGCGEIIYPITTAQENIGGHNTNGITIIVVILGVIAAAVLVVTRA